eukprot:PhM_4_TR4502/c0_g1_i1/m.7699
MAFMISIVVGIAVTFVGHGISRATTVGFFSSTSSSLRFLSPGVVAAFLAPFAGGFCGASSSFFSSGLGSIGTNSTCGAITERVGTSMTRTAPLHSEYCTFRCCMATMWLKRPSRKESSVTVMTKRRVPSLLSDSSAGTSCTTTRVLRTGLCVARACSACNSFCTAMLRGSTTTGAASSLPLASLPPAFLGSAFFGSGLDALPPGLALGSTGAGATSLRSRGTLELIHSTRCSGRPALYIASTCEYVWGNSLRATKSGGRGASIASTSSGESTGGIWASASSSFSPSSMSSLTRSRRISSSSWMRSSSSRRCVWYSASSEASFW